MTSSTKQGVEKGWAWLVLIAAYAGVLISCMAVYMNGVLYIALLETYHQSESRTALIGALHSSLQTSLGPFVSIAMKKFTSRVTIIAGGTLLTLACVCSAFVTKFDHLIITYGVMGGIGTAFSFIPCMVIPAYYFEKRRNLVSSLWSVVAGVGMLISSPVAFAILNKYGLHGTFLLLGGFNAQYIVIGLICRPSPIEQKLRSRTRNLSESYEHAEKKQNKSVGKVLNIISDTNYFKLLMNVPFLLYLFSTLTWNGTLAICIIHLPNYMSVNGSGPLEISTVMMCFSIANTIGRFIGSIASDRTWIDTLTLQVIMMGAAGISALTFPYYGVLPHADYMFSVILGVCAGCPNGLMTPIALRMVEMEALSTALGLEFMFCGVGFFTCPPIAAALYSQTQTYDNSFIFAGCIIIAGGVLAQIASYVLSRNAKNKKESTAAIAMSYTAITQPISQEIIVETEEGDTVKEGLLDDATAA